MIHVTDFFKVAADFAQSSCNPEKYLGDRDRISQTSHSGIRMLSGCPGAQNCG